MANLTVWVIEKSKAPISKAQVFVDDDKEPKGVTNGDGSLKLELADGIHTITAKAFDVESEKKTVKIPDETKIKIVLDLNLKCETRTEDGREEISYCRAGQFVEVRADIHEYPGHEYKYSWETGIVNDKDQNEPTILLLELLEKQNQRVVHLDTTGHSNKTIYARVAIKEILKSDAGASVSSTARINVRSNGTQAIADKIQRTGGSIAELASGVTLKRTRRKGTPEILTWQVIEKTTDALSFNNYKAFMDYVLCNDDAALLKLNPTEKNKISGRKTEANVSLKGKRFLPYTDTEAYRLLKVATEAFLIVNCGVLLEEFIDNNAYNQLLLTVDAEDASSKTAGEFWQQFLLTVNGDQSLVLPYLLLIRNKLPDLLIKRNIFATEEPFKSGEAERCYGILAEKLLHPCMVELIWSYWHEEGMLVQTMNALSRRFQNMRGPADQDPLAMVEIDPLRPLNNLLWGYIQDEQHRLTVIRRAYEYDHHYGLSLEGKAVPALRPADSRSRFLEAFHQLLHLASVFYKQDDDTTMVADGFPLLNALRDLHMLLSEGAHNQFGDLPTTARVEMLVQQWLLARPEFREYLPTRIMVAYPEPWMDRVDAMKRLQGWTDTSITHFRFLAIYGEQILLSIRFTQWSELDNAELSAIWARFFRNQIQGYIHAYRAVTGVDLSAEITTTQQRELITTKPSVLLRQRLAPALPGGQTAPALPAGVTPATPQGFRERRAARRITRG